MNYVMLEYIICPDGREFLVIDQRVYKRIRGQDWEPIDPDFLNKTTFAKNTRVRGILISDVDRSKSI